MRWIIKVVCCKNFNLAEDINLKQEYEIHSSSRGQVTLSLMSLIYQKLKLIIVWEEETKEVCERYKSFA